MKEDGDDYEYESYYEEDENVQVPDKGVVREP